jgi:hypothetical protein
MVEFDATSEEEVTIDLPRPCPLYHADFGLRGLVNIAADKCVHSRPWKSHGIAVVPVGNTNNK